MEGALAGVRVVEFANYVSGPYAGMLLGDLGADVIKVEEPTRGDPFRGWGRVEYSPTFASVNRNKKSVTIDLKSEAGKADARALVREADVVIDNFRPGTLERLGLGYADLTADNERLVWCSITGFGTDGPYAHRPGYDTVGQAMSGLLSLLTDPANPQPMGISLSDHLAGVTACNGILAALVARGRTGRGQRVDTSLLESAISFCGENMARYFDNGKVPVRATRTKQAQVYAFAAGDGKALVVHLSSPTKFWRALCEVVGRTQWLEDPRFESKESRGKNYDDVAQGLAGGHRHEASRLLAGEARGGGRAVLAAEHVRRRLRRSAGQAPWHEDRDAPSQARLDFARAQRPAHVRHARADPSRPARAGRAQRRAAAVTAQEVKGGAR